MDIVCCLQICLNILRAGLIASRVDLSVQKFPGVIAAPLVIGTIGGSGGKFLVDAIQKASGSLQGVPFRLNILYIKGTMGCCRLYTSAFVILLSCTSHVSA